MTDETLTAKLARLQHPDIDPTHYLYELARAFEAGQLVALDFASKGERETGFKIDGTRLFVRDPSICGSPTAPYIAVSALRSEFARRENAARVAGMRDVAGILEALPRRIEPLGGQMTSYVQLATAVDAIRAAADKSEAGE